MAGWEASTCSGTRMGTLVRSRSAVRTAARVCTSVATRSVGCAVLIMAGSSTFTVTASTCQPGFALPPYACPLMPIGEESAREHATLTQEPLRLQSFLLSAERCIGSTKATCSRGSTRSFRFKIEIALHVVSGASACYWARSYGLRRRCRLSYAERSVGCFPIRVSRIGVSARWHSMSDLAIFRISIEPSVDATTRLRRTAGTVAIPKGMLSS
jgi:hypothetical protein